MLLMSSAETLSQESSEEGSPDFCSKRRLSNSFRLLTKLLCPFAPGRMAGLIRRGTFMIGCCRRAQLIMAEGLTSVTLFSQSQSGPFELLLPWHCG
jgi:hypothetical protein